MWVWGGTSRCKLGLNNVVIDQMEPQFIEFEVQTKLTTHPETGKSDTEVLCEAFIDPNPKHKKNPNCTEYISEY